MPYQCSLSEPKNLKSEFLWKIAVYIRLSVADGKDESLSVSNQRKAIISFIENKFLESYIIEEIYVDDGLSGTDDDRLEFKRMITNIKRGNANCVICKNLSRIFRNYSDQGYFLEELFPLYGTRFISLRDPEIDTLIDPEKVNGFEVPISGIVNDRYSHKTSIEIRNTFRTMAEAGEFLGGFPPYGYIRDPQDKHKFFVDEDAANVVKEIFRLYVYEGYSKRGIALYLNERGIQNPSTYKSSKGYKYRNPKNDKNGSGYWSTVTIDRMLKNTTYLGHMVQGRSKVISYKVHKQIPISENDWITVEDTHEPIVDKEIFNKAQVILKRRGRTAIKSNSVHMFSGLIRCADCNRIMQRKRAGGSIYFTCKTYYDHKKSACARHSIREDVLCKVVLQTIQKQIALIEDLDKMAAKIQKESMKVGYSNKLLKMLHDTKKQLKKAEGIMDAAYLDWKQDTISKEQYLRMKEKMAAKQEHYKASIASLTEEVKQMESGRGQDNEVVKYFLKHKNVNSLNRALLVELVDAIYVHEDKSITIRFNYADQVERVLEMISESQSLLC